jgi:hypothetical protein
MLVPSEATLSVVGHIGFDKMAVGKDGPFDKHAYA